MTATVPRPHAGEFATFYNGYVERAMMRSESTVELADQRDAVCRILTALSDDRAAYRYAAGKWSIKDIVAHLADAERVFAYRLLRAARHDETPIPGFDENLYAQTAGADGRPIAALVDEWRATRDATIALVDGLAADVWERRVTANSHPISARALYYVILGHVDHHMWVLGERYGVGE